MNWLAHVFLSENTIEYQLGNLLTDPLKAQAWDGASDIFHKGIRTHLLIDSFTDTHRLVSKSKACLVERGHLKGVVLDILYDHFLSIHWEKFSSVPREPFLEHFRTKALFAIQVYPPKAQAVIERVVANRQLSSYITMEGVKSAYARIDNRLSAKSLEKDNATRYLPFIKREKDYLEEQFLVFFPELMKRVKQECRAERLEHWVK